MAFTWEQFHRKFLRYLLLKWVWNLLIWDSSQLPRGQWVNGSRKHQTLKRNVATLSELKMASWYQGMVLRRFVFKSPEEISHDSKNWCYNDDEFWIKKESIMIRSRSQVDILVHERNIAGICKCLQTFLKMISRQHKMRWIAYFSNTANKLEYEYLSRHVHITMTS